MSEHDIQSAVFQWAALATRSYPLLCTLFAIPNGTKLAGTSRDRAIQGAKLKAEGMRPGVPDVCLPVRTEKYGALFIEHKSDEGRVRENQQWWHERLTEAGALVIVSRSFEESRKAIVAYLEAATNTEQKGAPSLTM